MSTTKRYQMRVRMSYYVDVEVSANTLEQAKDLAIRAAPRAMARGDGCWGAEPSVTDYIQMDADEEGESK